MPCHLRASFFVLPILSVALEDRKKARFTNQTERTKKPSFFPHFSTAVILPQNKNLFKTIFYAKRPYQLE
jgi:hypothetical protein